jgi:hypothetical protein
MHFESGGRAPFQTLADWKKFWAALFWLGLVYF